MDKNIPIREIFSIQYGNQLDLNKQVECKSGINFVNRSNKNLGISTKIKKIEGIEPFEKGLITVALGGSILSAFVQPCQFYTGQNVKILKPREPIDESIKIFYCMCISQNAYRYSAFGREANKTFDNLLVPHSDECKKIIANYSTPKQPSEKPCLENKGLSLWDREWRYFNLCELFNISGSRSFTKKEIQEYGIGNYPYVVTSSENNGTEGFYNKCTEKGNVLTIDSATVGSCFYQPIDFSASDHVEKLIPKFSMNVFIALFLRTTINLERIRYGYGRKFAQMRIKNTRIKLPVKERKKEAYDPDWQFMEDYIKALPYSSNLQIDEF